MMPSTRPKVLLIDEVSWVIRSTYDAESSCSTCQSSAMKIPPGAARRQVSRSAAARRSRKVRTSAISTASTARDHPAQGGPDVLAEHGASPG